MTSIEEIASGETTLIDQLLADQQSLTAVATFSQQHTDTNEPAQSRYYKKLIPLAQPRPGEQYSFQVDLAACTGCKSCVTACNSLNGLDPDEAWRDTSLLIGGNNDNNNSLRQVVTSACHHCAEPTCASGCPVLAYEKDPVTGIVRHLDDQCIGCQYCILTCAYDVPKYNSRLGIVRKCDLCQSRLAEGEAPACVQACPNEAIKIKIIKTDDLPFKGAILPGMAASAHSRPSTTYLGSDDLPTDTNPADLHQLTPGHNHLPLVCMLTLTQASVGLFLFQFFFAQFSQEAIKPALNHWLSLSALIMGLSGVASSILHLGQPLKAWRAFLGLRHSWLSREIIAFGLWMPLATLYTLLTLFDLAPPALTRFIGALTVITGLLSITCSIMVYAVTPRPFWSLSRTAIRFTTTSLILGLASALTITTLHHQALPWLPTVLALALISKLIFELSTLLPAFTTSPWTPAQHSAQLQLHPLRRSLFTRFGLSAFALLLLTASSTPLSALLATTAIFSAELIARTLFFRAAVTSK